MAVSLGMRISGLLVVGAVAVAVTAFTGDGSDAPDGGGGHTIVTAGPSSGVGPRTPPPSPASRQSPAGEAGDTVRPSAPRPTHSATAPPRTSPAPSPGRSGSLLLSPSWLPPGPVSPDADPAPDPAGVYDRLRDPGRCGAALQVVPAASADPEWQVLHALATACLAVQGRGGNWAEAAAAHAGPAGKAATCKGRAAYAVLGGLLDFHRLHPHTTVRLKTSPVRTPACAYRIAGVDTAEAEPGDTVGIELRDTYFDHGELLRFGSVFIGGQLSPGPVVLRSEAGDALVLAAVVPPMGGGYPRSADVVVRYGGTEARLKDALTVVAPTAAIPSPGVPSGTPQGMLPLGPLPADPPRP